MVWCLYLLPRLRKVSETFLTTLTVPLIIKPLHTHSTGRRWLGPRLKNIDNQKYFRVADWITVNYFVFSLTPKL